MRQHGAAPAAMEVLQQQHSVVKMQPSWTAELLICQFNGLISRFHPEP